MNRATVAAEVGVRLSAQLADVGLTAADTTGNLKEPIDDALRAMGTAEADLATAAPDDATGFLAMVRYHTLRRVWELQGDRFNVGLAGKSFSLQQAFANTERLLNLAAADVVRLFGTLDPAGSAVVTLDLNYLSLDDDEYTAAYG